MRVELERPIETAGHQDFCCRFRIAGLGPDFSSHACGIDAVQALMLTIAKIEAILRSSHEFQDGRLTWLGRTNGDLGLTLPDDPRKRGT